MISCGCLLGTCSTILDSDLKHAKVMVLVYESVLCGRCGGLLIISILYGTQNTQGVGKSPYLQII